MSTEDKTADLLTKGVCTLESRFHLKEDGLLQNWALPSTNDYILILNHPQDAFDE